MTESTGAEALSKTAPPDVVLGRLSLWVGGPCGHDGWLDVALRVGDDHHDIAATSGPLVQVRDLIAFEPALRTLSDSDKGEATLASDGGSLRVRVTRYSRDHGNYVEVGLRRSIYDQKISFSIAKSSYSDALIGLRAVLTRLEEEREARRRPVERLDPPPAWALPASQRSGAFLAEDYPADAFEARELGVAEVDYVVSAEGRVVDLRLTRPSGVDALDAATLAILATRFRYEPAEDATGRPVPHKQRRKVAWLRRWEAPEVLDAAEVTLRYVVDGVGWFSVSVDVGAAHGDFGGSSWMTAAMGDLLRVGTALACGVTRAEAEFNAEPCLTRVEFEVDVLNSSVPARKNQWSGTSGCWIRIREIDHQTLEPKPAEFEALCYSPLAVAEAIYLMALPHFEQNERIDYPAFMALAAAIGAARTQEP
jgi:TonB family protein